MQTSRKKHLHSDDDAVILSDRIEPYRPCCYLEYQPVMWWSDPGMWQPMDTLPFCTTALILTPLRIIMKRQWILHDGRAWRESRNGLHSTARVRFWSEKIRHHKASPLHSPVLGRVRESDNTWFNSDHVTATPIAWTGVILWFHDILSPRERIPGVRDQATFWVGSMTRKSIVLSPVSGWFQSLITRNGADSVKRRLGLSRALYSATWDAWSIYPEGYRRAATIVALGDWLKAGWDTVMDRWLRWRR